jgi:hypothetical protein
MTSTPKGPSGQDDRPSGQGAEPDRNQLDLFGIVPGAGIRTDQPPAVSGDDDAGSLPVDQRPAETHVETMVSPAAARDPVDVGAADSDDLRRLEESIRWLMNAGAMPLQQAATPAPVSSLPSLGRHEDDSFLLDPDTLFAPRAPRRFGPVAAGAAKLLLVSAIAAPTAYFTASWLQLSGIAAPFDLAGIAGVRTRVAPSGEQVAAVAPAHSIPAPPVPVPVLSISSAPQAAHEGVEAAAATAQPEPAVAPRPATRATGVALAAIATELATAAAPEAPSTVAVQPADPVSEPTPVRAVKPQLRQEEIAMLIERGRMLFEAGDLASARLFFRRAAKAGDAAAAIAMGATYDPEVLTQRFIRGIDADPQEAQRWYERAREMGQPVELAQHQ